MGGPCKQGVIVDGDSTLVAECSTLCSCGPFSWSSGVQSAAVNVICELARRNPKNYLSLAPLFFKLMTSSTNNWVLIKIIKLVSAEGPGVCWAWVHGLRVSW